MSEAAATETPANDDLSVDEVLAEIAEGKFDPSEGAPSEDEEDGEAEAQPEKPAKGEKGKGKKADRAKAKAKEKEPEKGAAKDEKSEDEAKADEEPAKKEPSEVAKVTKQHRALDRRKRELDALESQAATVVEKLERRAEEVAHREAYFENLMSLRGEDLLYALADHEGIPRAEFVKRQIIKLGKSEIPEAKNSESDLERRILGRLSEVENNVKQTLEQKEAARVKERHEEVVANYSRQAFARLNEDDHPFLSELPRSQVRERMLKNVDKYGRATGRLPDPDELWEVMEEEEAEKAEQYAARLAKRRGDAADLPARKGGAAGSSGLPAQSQKAARGASITNGMAAERGAAPPDTEFENLTLDEQLEILARERKAS